MSRPNSPPPGSRTVRTRFRAGNHPYHGFTLVEVLVAITILVCTGLAAILVFRQGGGKTETFSAEHYSAMFLTQKIFEDIGSRLRENPHFFGELKKMTSGDLRTVVKDPDGFFHLLDNTEGFSYLDETQDGPISEQQNGSLFRQLKDFRYSVTATPGVEPKSGTPIPGLLEVKAGIYWKESGGAEKEYHVSHLVQGFDESVFKPSSENDSPTLPEEDIVLNLWEVSGVTPPADKSFDGFMAQNGGDWEVVFDIGTMIRVWVLCENINEQYNSKILTEAATRDAAKAVGDQKSLAKAAVHQEAIARMFEEKASYQAGIFLLGLPCVFSLSSQSFDQSTMGSLLTQAVDSFAPYFWKDAFLPKRIVYDFEASRALYESLLKPPYKDALSQRKITTIARKVVDLYKMVTLIEAGTPSRGNHLSELQSFLNFLNRQFIGKQPHFVSYLNAEFQVCSSLETLRSFYGGKEGLAGKLKDLGTCHEVLKEIYASIPPGYSFGVGQTETGSLTVVNPNGSSWSSDNPRKGGNSGPSSPETDSGTGSAVGTETGSETDTGTTSGEATDALTETDTDTSNSRGSP